MVSVWHEVRCRSPYEQAVIGGVVYDATNLLNIGGGALAEDKGDGRTSIVLGKGYQRLRTKQ